jgi:hypothetical protein
VATEEATESSAVFAAQLGAILDQQLALTASVRDLSERLNTLAAEVKVHGVKEALARQTEILRAIYEEEPGNRRRLWALRESPEYARPFEEENPLVTIFIPTYSNAESLAERSIPSVLAQTYENLEVLVIGDAAPPEVEEAARSFDDPRLRFLNLGIRGPYPDDPVGLWRVAGSAPSNEGVRIAQGQWIGVNGDDDLYTPTHVELLLAEARRRRLELVYGDIRRVNREGEDDLLCTFPPRNEHFGMQAALFHRGLRIFSYELEVFDDGADWAWMRRMLRLGVRIGMINDVVVDYYSSNQWGTPDREPGTLG